MPRTRRGGASVKESASAKADTEIPSLEAEVEPLAEGQPEVDVEVVIEDNEELGDVKPKKISKAERKKEEVIVDVPEPKESSSPKSQVAEAKDAKRRNLEEVLTNKMMKEIVSAASKKLTAVLPPPLLS